MMGIVLEACVQDPVFNSCQFLPPPPNHHALIMILVDGDCHVRTGLLQS